MTIDKNDNTELSDEESKRNLDELSKRFGLGDENKIENTKAGISNNKANRGRMKRFLEGFRSSAKSFRGGVKGYSKSLAESKTSQRMQKIQEYMSRKGTQALGNKADVQRMREGLKRKQQEEINKLTRGYKEKEYSSKISTASTEEKKSLAEERLRKYLEKQKIQDEKQRIKDKYNMLGLKIPNSPTGNKQYQKFRYRKIVSSSGRPYKKVYGVSGWHAKQQGTEGKLRGLVKRKFQYQTEDNRKYDLMLDKQDYVNLRRLQTRVLKRDLSSAEVERLLPNYLMKRKMQQMKQSQQEELPSDNKFLQQLRFEEQQYNRQHYNRLVNTQPHDFVKRVVAMKRASMQQAQQFSQNNNIMNARMGLNEKENAIDFLDEQHNILNAENLFSANNPNAMNIFKPSGRPTILNCNSTGNNVMMRRPDSIDILGVSEGNEEHRIGFW